MCSQVFSNFTTYIPNNNIGVPYASTVKVIPSVSINEVSSGSERAVNEKTVGMAALLQSIALCIQKGSQWFARQLESGKEFTSAENVKLIAQNMVKEHKLGRVTVDYISDLNKAKYAGSNLASEIEIVAKGKNAFYSDIHKLAVAPASKPSLILHELGHASNSKKLFTQLLQKSRRYAVSAPMILLFASRILGRDKDNKPNFIERNAGILGFAAFLPTIIEEGLASLKGIKAVKAVPQNILKGGLNTSILKRNYLLALCTYILGGVGLGIASKQTILENSTTNSRLTSK